MPLIPPRFRRRDPEVERRDAIRKEVAVLAKAIGVGAGTSGGSGGAMGPVMPGSQFQGGWNNLGNASLAMLQRVTANMARQHNVPVADIEQELIEQGLTWGPPFPPGRPLDPFFGYRRPPRTRDYSVGENVQLTPRWSRISFETIKGIYEAYDVAQIVVRHLINDVRSLDFDWVPLDGERDDVSQDIDTARKFFAYPDREQPFRNWLAEYLQDVLRYDAGTLYIRRTEAGAPYALEVVTGASIIPLIDFYGRVAADRDDDNPPEMVWPGGAVPGFLQIVEGMPWDWLTKDDIVYQPWNPLPESQYGLAPLEAVLLTANTDIRFQWHFLQYFTEGTLPAGFMEAPPDMSDPAQIDEWQQTWDALMSGDQSMLRKIRWVPNGSKFTAAKNSDFNADFPLYLMRRVCAAYGVTPADLGFTETVNKATSEVQVDVQWRVGTLPLVRHVEDVINLVVAQQLGLRCRIQFDKGQEVEDRLSQAELHQAYVNMGAYSLDEVRAELGKPIDRSRPFPRFVSNPRVGAIPLIAIESMAGKIDEETYGPDKSQLLISNPYMPVPGVLPNQGTPELKAVETASAQAGRDILEQSAGGKPGPEMQALIDAAKPAPPVSQGAPSKGPEGTTAQPNETPPAEGAGSRPEPEDATSKEANAGGFMSTSGIQGSPLVSGAGISDDDEDDDEERRGAEKSAQALIELRRWRENARNRLRKGQPPRPFRSHAIPQDVADLIWVRLQKAETRQEVNAIFADVVSGRPFGIAPAPGSDGRRCVTGASYQASGLPSGAGRAEEAGRITSLVPDGLDGVGVLAGRTSKTADRVKADKDDFGGIVAGGLIVQAADTGRLLMIQRTPDKHDDDAAYARWEWPGGCLDVNDPGVWDGALREWEEETGATLSEDAEHLGAFLDYDGRYQAYVIRVPSEDLDLDPQPEEVSQAGWWAPGDLMGGEVRDKVRENLPLLDRFLDEQLPSPAAKAATPASWHRHTDRIVEHYQPQIAEALEQLFPANALREAIQQAKDAQPGVEKALIPEVVSRAVSALRGRVKPSAMLARLLPSIWGDAALQAARSASEAITGTMGSLQPLMAELPDDYWSKWVPGWGDAAARLADGGLRGMLDQADISIQGMTDTSIDLLGNEIARGVEAGDSVDSIAAACQGLLANPQRAFMIADTEVARAMSTQALDSYQQSGVAQVEWLAEDDACEECLALADGSPYPVDDMPDSVPQHPLCRCSLSPVVDTGERSSSDI